MRLKFDYRKFPSEPSDAFPRRRSATRPVIPITIINGDSKIANLALIDSGADLCLFHADIGEQIGINIESGKKLTFSGITKDKLTAYFHNIKISISGYEHECYAGFSRDLANMPYGILGQHGFFNLYKILFDYEKDRVELITKDNP